MSTDVTGKLEDVEKVDVLQPQAPAGHEASHKTGNVGESTYKNFLASGGTISAEDNKRALKRIDMLQVFSLITMT